MFRKFGEGSILRSKKQAAKQPEWTEDDQKELEEELYDKDKRED